MLRLFFVCVSHILQSHKHLMYSDQSGWLGLASPALASVKSCMFTGFQQAASEIFAVHQVARWCQSVAQEEQNQEINIRTIFQVG